MALSPWARQERPQLFEPVWALIVCVCACALRPLRPLQVDFSVEDFVGGARTILRAVAQENQLEKGLI